jgi:MFS family permease
MNSQDTLTHIRLWHKDFWLMAIASLLIAMAATMLIPSLPKWMLFVQGLSADETGYCMGAFALGLFLPGAFCSYLVQRFRRNVVCVWSVLLFALSVGLPAYATHIPFVWMLALRVVQGAFFGLAQMVLASTLIIDTCESSQRTEANHSASWFGRFALSLGPMAALLVAQFADDQAVLLVSAGCCVLTALLVLMVKFPFRAPIDNPHLFSLDRFLLVHGVPLLLNLLPLTIATGMIMSLPLDATFYGQMMVGFLLSLLAERFVFAEAELKSEIVSGTVLMTAALLVILFVPTSPLASPLLALGLGIVGARFLLLFIKLSRHCQRGTAQSTFLLGWESGIALGVGIGYTCFDGERSLLLIVAIGLVVVSLLLYGSFIHRWFILNKNR